MKKLLLSCLLGWGALALAQDENADNPPPPPETGTPGALAREIPPPEEVMPLPPKAAEEVPPPENKEVPPPGVKEPEAKEPEVKEPEAKETEAKDAPAKADEETHPLLRAFDDFALDFSDTDKLAELELELLKRRNPENSADRQQLAREVEKFLHLLRPLAVSSRIHYQHYELFNGLLTSLREEPAQKAIILEDTLRLSQQAHRLGVISAQELGDAYMNASWFWVLMKEPGWARAEALGKEGLTVAPDHGGVAVNLFHALALQGKENEALALFYRFRHGVVEMPPNDSRSFYLTLTNDFDELKAEEVWNDAIAKTVQKIIND